MYRFTGTEEVTIELAGAFDPVGLDVPARVELDRDADGRARVSLFAFAVRGIRIAGVPLVRASYDEVLWRIAVRDGGVAMWWALACDLGARGARIAARRWVRYPVRSQLVEVTSGRLGSRGEAGELEVLLGDVAGRATIDARPLLTGRDAAWHVPWGDDSDAADAVGVTVGRDSLGAATVGAAIAWESTAAVRRNRLHRCGVARRV